MHRRAFLRALAAGGSAGALGATAGCLGGGDGSADGTVAPNTFELGGEVAGWRGRAPASIDGTQNPALALTPGETYTVTWENLDGAPHDFVIEDADGERLEGTEATDETGATRSLTFTASAEMAAYVCTFHPTSMRGEIRHDTGESGDG